MNLFFVFDEYSDIEDEHTVRELSDIVMDALRNPDKPRPRGESIVGEIARQYVLISCSVVLSIKGINESAMS
jgi:Delta6-protoilludene synthase